MEHLANATGLALSPGDTWETMSRREFNLTPRELATLVAITAYVATNGKPMPYGVLEYAATIEHDDPETPCADMTTPGRLAALGLVLLIGRRDGRSYDASVAALRRLAR